MTATVDVAVGLIFVYLVLSLLSSSVAETLEHYFRYRADYLRKGIQKLLLADSAKLSEEFYSHPLIRSLYVPSWWEGKGRSAGPSYIPSGQFVLALLDTVTKGAMTAAPSSANPPGTAPRMSVAQVLTALEANEKSGFVPPALGRALRTLISDAGEDMGKLKTGIQQWFDGSMDRVAGWYKRRAQFVLLVIGAAVAVGINVDTLAIVQTLSNDSAVRAAVVAAAETYAREHPQGPGNASPNRPIQAGQAPAATTQPGAANASPPRTSGATNASGSTPAPRTEPSGAVNASPGNVAGNQPSRSPSAPIAQGPSAGSLGQTASDVQRDVKKVVDQLSVLGLPIGWRYQRVPEPCDTAEDRPACLIEQRVWPQQSGRTPAEWWLDWRQQFTSHLLGWLLTAFAISFGAPFWFDTLNKIMVIRSTVKPREKSQEEASEDRQRR